MKRVFTPGPLRGLAAFGLIASCLGAPPAMGMCIPFYCPDCDLRSSGQISWLILDPDGQHIGMIPNVRLQGQASDFGLVVPTPSVPDLVPVSVELWDDSFAFTAAATARGDTRGGDALGCGSEVVYAPSLDRGSPEEVDILVQKTVGEFDVAVLSASDPQDLVDWLNQNGFAYDPEDVARFGPYVEAGWVFTVMHLTEGAQVPPTWDTNVDPVLFTFQATGVTVPLPLLAIHRADFFPMSFFVAGDHRMDLPGFTTAYANRLDAGELQAVRERYPTVASFLTPDRFVTRLDRFFQPDDAMDEDLVLVRASSDAEFRRVNRGVVWGAFPGWAAALFAGFWIAWRLDRRRRREPA